MQSQYDEATIRKVAHRAVKHMLRIARKSFKTKDKIILAIQTMKGRYGIFDYYDETHPPQALVDLKFPLDHRRSSIINQLSNMIIKEFDPEADTSHSWYGQIVRHRTTIQIVFRKNSIGAHVILRSLKSTRN